MIYPIVVYGHPVLKKVATDIDRDHPVFSSLFMTCLKRCIMLRDLDLLLHRLENQ